jgi:transcriptional regulator with XRE-family HTH domain
MVFKGDSMTYQERIRALREDADLSQTQIAKELKIAQTTYSQYELGKRSIPIETLIILCKYYKVSADYILGLDRKNTP